AVPGRRPRKTPIVVEMKNRLTMNHLLFLLSWYAVPNAQPQTPTSFQMLQIQRVVELASKSAPGEGRWRGRQWGRAPRHGHSDRDQIATNTTIGHTARTCGTERRAEHARSHPRTWDSGHGPGCRKTGSFRVGLGWGR